MLSNKPYLIRAFYDWIVDSACTPFLVVNANFPHCTIPREYVENGEITLNISPSAIRDFKITKEFIEFRASFSGVVHMVSAPVQAVLAVYAQENQQGMFFDYEEENADVNSAALAPPSPILQTEQVTNSASQKQSSHLRLVE